MAERRCREVKHSPVNQPQVINLAERFKTTFSRDNVRVHFVGVWCVAQVCYLCLPVLTLGIQGYRFLRWHPQG